MKLAQKRFIGWPGAAVLVAGVVLAGYMISHVRAASVPGDLNNDGTVNVFDLSIILSHWNANYHTISSTFAHTAPATGAYDYAYDVWFNNYGIELMVWTQSGGRQAHVPGITTVGTVTIGGITYNIHRNGTYIAYDMQNTTTSGTVDILAITKDAQTRGFIPSTAVLTQLDYGVEVCDTGGVNTKFELNNFSLTTN
jgi:hypothetical protein